MPPLENELKRAFTSPTPSHWTVSRDINQFPSSLDNSHQPSKHVLLVITHLKVIKPSHQHTFSAPLHGRTIWKSLVFPVSFSPTLSPLSPLIWFPPTPLHWKDPYQGHQCGFVKEKLILCSHFTFWQHWTSLAKPSFPVHLLL